MEVAGTITGAGYGTFDQGYIEHGAIIPLPTLAALAQLTTYATQGGMTFTAPRRQGRPRSRGSASSSSPWTSTATGG